MSEENKYIETLVVQSLRQKWRLNKNEHEGYFWKGLKIDVVTVAALWALTNNHQNEIFCTGKFCDVLLHLLKTASNTYMMLISSNKQLLGLICKVTSSENLSLEGCPVYPLHSFLLYSVYFQS